MVYGLQPRQCRPQPMSIQASVLLASAKWTLVVEFTFKEIHLSWLILNYASYLIIAFRNVHNQEGRMQAESGLCVCTGRGLLLECSLVFYRPFCPVLARENSCLAPRRDWSLHTAEPRRIKTAFGNWPKSYLKLFILDQCTKASEVMSLCNHNAAIWLKPVSLSFNGRSYLLLTDSQNRQTHLRLYLLRVKGFASVTVLWVLLYLYIQRIKRKLIL